MPTGKRFYEFDNFNVDMSEATDRSLMDDVVNANEVSLFFDKDPVGMALLSDVKTKAIGTFHEIARCESVEEGEKVLRENWTSLKMMSYLVSYIDSHINIGDAAQSQLDQRDEIEGE